MKHKSLTDSQSALDDSIFSLTADEIGATFTPQQHPTNTIVNGAVQAFPESSVTVPSLDFGLSGPSAISAISTSTMVSLGGITFNLIWSNAAANLAPERFRAGVEQAATLLAAVITDKITVNIKVDYDGNGGFALGGPDGQPLSESYSSVTANLISHATPGDTTFNALPAGSSIQQQANVDVYNSQAKLWGQLGANDTSTDDGGVDFATDVNPLLLAGVALHELTHAIGRVPDGPQPNVFDLFRFTSQGVRLFDGDIREAPPAYFSIDGGVTKLADYGQGSDPSDFLNAGVQGPDDPFNEFYSSSTNQFLSAVDLQQLDALGFHVQSQVPSVTYTSFGSTKLDQVGIYFYLDPINGAPGSGPLLKLDDAPVSTLDPFTISATWRPIAVQQTSTGYEIAWFGAGEYFIWNTDSQGNFLVEPLSAAGRFSFALESAELSFQQDLNGDGIIGVHHIETSGSTNVDLLGQNYFLDPAAGGPLNPFTGAPGPVLEFNGLPEVVGQFTAPFGVWTVVGAEKTATGYEVAWDVPGTDLFRIANTDNNGNYVSVTLVSATSEQFLQSLEPSFQQDLNGDGVIGPVPSVFIDVVGTPMRQSGVFYYMYNSAGTVGFLLSDAGTPVVPGRYGTFAPIATEQTATGFDVAWQDSATGNFRVWTTDSTGNHTSTLLDNVAGTDLNLEALEPVFKEDLNGDGVIGVRIVVEASGTIQLDLVESPVSGFFLDPVGGKAESGPLLKFAGEPVPVVFADMDVLGAERLGTGYEVAFKAATADSYFVWSADSNGNLVSTLINWVSGTSPTLEAAETSFQQDLNGDGHIGPVTVIEASGSTKLDLVGNNYFFDPVSGGAGPLLKYQGAAVVVGQFGAWTPLGAEQTASGYEVAWKVVGADEYQVWNTDSNGNFVSTGSALSGTSIVLEATEVSFHQDLNGDGIIGVPPTTIEAFGTTKLDLAGATFSLDPVNGDHGPTLNFQGAAVIPGEFGSWTPIGAEQTSSGYEIAWKVNGADQYILWTTDSNGNYVTQGPALIGSSIVLEAAEVSMHQDLNGDGIIGVPATVVEAFGSTKLDLAGSTYSLDPVSGGQGPILKFGGAAVVPGEFGSWTAIGAEQTSSGYEVAWKVDSADQYIVWNTDHDGNYVSQGGAVTGASFALETAETSFHQDLNGDGVVGIPNIEAFGATRLDLVDNTYSLDPVSGGQGPTLKYQGAAVTPGQFVGLTPIGAEKTASGGFEIAWKDATGGFSIWSTDNNGNYVSTVLDHVVPTNTNLEMQESFFQQDVNGDGVIGVPPTPPSGPDGGPVESPPASGPGGDAFVFRPGLGTNSTMASVNLTPLDSQTSSAVLLPELTSNGSVAGLETLLLQGSDLSVDNHPSASLHHLADMHSGVLIH